MGGLSNTSELQDCPRWPLAEVVSEDVLGVVPQPQNALTQEVSWVHPGTCFDLTTFKTLAFLKQVAVLWPVTIKLLVKVQHHSDVMQYVCVCVCLTTRTSINPLPPQQQTHLNPYVNRAPSTIILPPSTSFAAAATTGAFDTWWMW